ncbi:hypothetical protein V1512DRAFT_292665 [Lipomyces arxii]|uniref:uncharacterized protein n=1 Tax=Lipomyces arxii TaxID=56418 RepID=UPI0034CD77DE
MVSNKPKLAREFRKYLDLSSTAAYLPELRKSDYEGNNQNMLEHILKNLESELQSTRADTNEVYGVHFRYASSIAASKQYCREVDGGDWGDESLVHICTGNTTLRIQEAWNFKDANFLDELRANIEIEKNLGDEVVALGEQLEIEIEMRRRQSQLHSGTRSQFSKVLSRQEGCRKLSRDLMMDLRGVLEATACVLVTEEKNKRKKSKKGFKGQKKMNELWEGTKQIGVSREGKKLLEDLLNQAFVNGSDNWVSVPDPDSAIVRLLIKAEIAVTRGADSRVLRLRDFSRLI